MTKRSPLPGLLLCLLLLSSAVPGLAQEREDPLAKMEREGWTAVQEGVLQRQAKPGELETFVFGTAGFTWKLQDLRSQLQILRREHEARPTPELRKAIASHRRMIANTQRMIERARAAEAGGKSYHRLESCNLRFGFDAEAGPKVNVRGTWAAASAELKLGENCWDDEGEVYAYAFAKATVNGAPTTATVTDGPRTGGQVSASADAQRNGGPDCESYAYSSVTNDSLYPTSYSTSKSNTSCPAASSPSTLQISLTSEHDGELEVVIWEGECATLHWTVGISGGTPLYTSNIYRDGVFQRTGTSYSEQFCFYPSSGEEYPEFVEVMISAQVTDSAGQSRFIGHETRLRYRWWLY